VINVAEQLHCQRTSLDGSRAFAGVPHLQIRAPAAPVIRRVFEDLGRVGGRPPHGGRVPANYSPMLLACLQGENAASSVRLQFERKRGPQTQRVLAEGEHRAVFHRARFLGRSMEIKPGIEFKTDLGDLGRPQPPDDDSPAAYFFGSVLFGPGHHVSQLDILPFYCVSPPRDQNRCSGLVALLPQISVLRREPTEASLLRIEQRTKNGRTVEVGRAEPTYGAIGGDQRARPAVTDDAVPVDGRESARICRGTVHSAPG
jgi:hypothetical protein